MFITCKFLCNQKTASALICFWQVTCVQTNLIRLKSILSHETTLQWKFVQNFLVPYFESHFNAFFKETTCKRTQHCWPTTPKIAGFYILRPFCTPCCMLLHAVRSCCAKFETGQTFSSLQTDAITANNAGSCWPTMSRPFVLGFIHTWGSQWG